MRRAVFVAVLLCILALAGTARAVTLDQGWYAWFGGAYLQVTDWSTGEPYVYSAHWYPTTSLGQYGPVTVSQWAGYPSTRQVAVPQDVSVTPGVLFQDTGSIPLLDRTYPCLYASWQTNYDANRMRLQLLRRRSGQDVMIWEQATSGRVTSSVDWNIRFSSPFQPGDELVMRVIALPEPGGLTALGCGVSALLVGFRRRKS